MIVPLLSALAVASVPTSTASGCRLELRARSIDLSLADETVDASDAALFCSGSGGQARPHVQARSMTWTQGEFRLVDARFTTCVAPEGGDPDWELRLGRATIDPERGARARGVIFAVRGVPVMALPAASVPLGRRRSGLLVPDLDGSAIFGLRARQPVHWVIGRSWDATVEPAIATRRGPEAALELRGAPAEGATLEVQPRFQLDYGAPRERGFAWARPDPLFRWALDGRAEVGRRRGPGLGARLALRGDPAWVAERGASFQARAVEYSRSRVTWSSGSGDGGIVAVGAHLLQDLRASTYAAVADDLRAVSTLSSARPGPGETRYRLVEARWDLLPRPVFSSAAPAVDVAARFHAFGTTAGDVGRFVRLDLRPELRWPASLPGRVTVEPWVAVRATGWWGAASSADAGVRLAPVAGGRLRVELDHAVGRHLLQFTPGLEGVVIPDVWASLPGDRLLVGDEVDLLGPVAQAALRLESSVLDLARGERVGGVSLFVGRDFGIAGRPGRGTLEAVGRADHRWRAPGSPLEVESDVAATWSFAKSSVPEVSVGAGVRHPRGRLRVAYRRLAEQPAASSFVAPEELVPSATLGADGLVPISDHLAGSDRSRVFERPLSAADVLIVSASIRPLRTLVWEADLALALASRVAAEAVYGPDVSVVQSFGTRIRWAAPCGCWSAGFDVGSARDRPGWDVAARVELGGVGSTATR